MELTLTISATAYLLKSNETCTSVRYHSHSVSPSHPSICLFLAVPVCNFQKFEANQAVNQTYHIYWHIQLLPSTTAIRHLLQIPTFNYNQLHWAQTLSRLLRDWQLRNCEPSPDSLLFISHFQWFKSNKPKRLTWSSCVRTLNLFPRAQRHCGKGWRQSISSDDCVSTRSLERKRAPSLLCDFISLNSLNHRSTAGL